MQSYDYRGRPTPPSHPPPMPHTNGDYRPTPYQAGTSPPHQRPVVHTLPPNTQPPGAPHHADHSASLDRNTRPPLAPKPDKHDKEKKRGSMLSFFKKKEKDKKDAK